MSACSAKKNEPPANPGLNAVTDACSRLKDTGFALACPVAQKDGAGYAIDFDLTGGIAGLRGRITSKPTTSTTDFVPLQMSSPGLTIQTTMPTENLWTKCLRTATAGQCARKMPKEYAWHHALYDEAKRIIGGIADTGACNDGFLCGAGCTKSGLTCCIDVGRADRSCPGDNRCTVNGQCEPLNGPPPSAAPAAGGGGGSAAVANPCGGGCRCNDGSCGSCGRGGCSHHGGIQ